VRLNDVATVTGSLVEGELTGYIGPMTVSGYFSPYDRM
jgi:hypothetical protein